MYRNEKIGKKLCCMQSLSSAFMSTIGNSAYQMTNEVNWDPINCTSCGFWTSPNTSCKTCSALMEMYKNYNQLHKSCSLCSLLLWNPSRTTVYNNCEFIEDHIEKKSSKTKIQETDD